MSVEVPAGIADGQRIRVAGRGHAGERGGPPGDLYVHLSVSTHPRFQRDGYDLTNVLHLPVSQAALGAHIEFETLDGTEDLVVPAEALTVRGAGMPALRGSRRGNLRVVVNVVVPRHLDSGQRDLYERLADSMTEHNLRSEEGVFAKLRRAFGG